MRITDHIPLSGTAAALGIGVLWLLSILATVWGTRAVIGPVDAPTDSTQKDRPMRTADLPDATPADYLEIFAAPDSNDTVTRCNTIPRFLASKKTPADFSDASGSTLRSETRHSPKDSVTSSGLAYDIIPTREGRPTVSVGPSQVVFPTFDPVTGRGERRTIDIPVPKNELDVFAETGLMPSTPYVMSGAEYTRDIGTLDVWGARLDLSTSWRGGYAATRYGHSPVGAAALSIGIHW